MFRYLALGGVALSGFSLGAEAELPANLIKSYNAAMATQNPAEIVPAAQALAAAVVADPSAPDAGVIAFETASQLCLRGACAKAAGVAQVAAASHEAGLPPESERQLVAAYAAWSAAPDAGTTATFDTALDRYAPEPPTSISVAAFNARYVAEAKSGSSEALSKAARRAADHLRPGREHFAQEWADAELAALGANFIRTTDYDTLLPMAELEIWLCDRYCESDGGSPDWISDLLYKARAWNITIYAHLQRSNPSDFRLSDHNARMEAQYTKLAERAPRKESQPSFCPGDLSPMPLPVYPESLKSSGTIETVITAVDVEEGRVINRRVLASVPTGQFDEAALRAFDGVKFKFKRNPPKGCARSFVRTVVPFVFVPE